MGEYERVDQNNEGKSAGMNEELNSFLTKADGERIDICAQVFRILSACSDSVQQLQYFCEDGYYIESSQELPVESVFTESQKQQLTKQCGTYVDGLLEKLIQRNYEIDEFYRKLWEAINSDTLLASEDERIFALYYIWIDTRIPYYKLDAGLKMSKDEYSRIIDSIIDKIKKMKYIMFSNFDQKTERSSLLMDLLDELELREEKIVLLSQIVTISEKKGKIQANQSQRQ